VLVAALVLLTVVLVPALSMAAGQFSDDDGNTHESNIEWLASKGITVGCGPAEFCPYKAVTRGQMATFMQRLVDFLGDPNTGKVDDADRLDGMDSAAFSAASHNHDSRYVNGSDHTKAAHDALNIDADTLDGEHAGSLQSISTGCGRHHPPNLLGSDFQCDLSLTTSVAGAIALNGSVELWGEGIAGNDQVFCDFTIGVPAAEVRWSRRDVSLTGTAFTPEGEINCSSNTWVEVPAGTHTIAFRVYSVGPQTAVGFVGANAIFTPAG
jgi:hypothetical protein